MKTKDKYIWYSTVIILVVIVAVYVLYRYDVNANREIIQGTAECRTYRASSKIPGRIDSMFVSVGEWVEKGELLYTISTPELRAKLEQVAALESAAEALNEEVERGARREQIEAAHSMLQKAIAGLELADKSYIRIKRLYDKGVATRQQYDEALAAQQAMQANVDAAHAEYRLVVEGATREQKQAAEAKVREARGAVDEVNTYINDACVYAPVSGRISNIIAEPGELVSAGYPVITILDLTDRWIVFNIKENAMHGIEIGYMFNGVIPAINKESEFEIDYIAPEADFATWSSTRARGGFDIRTFEVHATPRDTTINILPGMSVIVFGDRL